MTLLDLTTVVVVLDPEFGAQLFAIAEVHPVWVIDSPMNRPVIEALWSQRRHERAPREVAVFRTIEGLSPEEHVLQMLGSVAQQHGPEAQSPPFTTLVVDGAKPDDAVRARLRELGAATVEPTGRGFRARFERRA